MSSNKKIDDFLSAPASGSKSDRKSSVDEFIAKKNSYSQVDGQNRIEEFLAKGPEPVKRDISDYAKDVANYIGESAEGALSGVSSGYTYGHDKDLIDYILKDKGVDNTKKEIFDFLDKSKEKSPKAYLVGELAGNVVSPATKVLGALGSLGSSKLEILSKAAKSPILQKALQTLGFTSENIAPLIGMTAAQKGDSDLSDYAAASIVGTAAKKAPYVTAGALTASQLANIVEGGEAYPKELAAAALLGGLASKGSKTALDIVNAKRDPEILKAPLEALEKAYLERGEKVPPVMRGAEKEYSIPDWEHQSDFVRGLRKIKDSATKDLLELPESTRKVYSEVSEKLGGLKEERLADIIGDPEKYDYLLSALEKLNKEQGIMEDSRVTLQKTLKNKIEASDNPTYNPMGETVGDVILGRMRAAPIRGLRMFKNSYADVRSKKEFNPELTPKDVEELYLSALRADKDVQTGRLNKWLELADKSDNNDMDYIRLFDPNKKWDLLSDRAAQARANRGDVVVSERDLRNINRQNNNAPVDEVANETTSDIIDRLIREFSEKNKDKNYDMGLGQEGGTTNAQSLSERANSASKILMDMREGQRQIRLDRKNPSSIPYFITDLVDRLTPLRYSELNRLYDFLPIKNIEKYDKNLEHHARKYAEGKAIELGQIPKKQIYRLEELAKNDDRTGMAAKSLLEYLKTQDAKALEDAVKFSQVKKLGDVIDIGAQ
jgi:hypothetical protein